MPLGAVRLLIRTRLPGRAASETTCSAMVALRTVPSLASLKSRATACSGTIGCLASGPLTFNSFNARTYEASI